MFGPRTDPGLIPRSMADLLKKLEDKKKTSENKWTWTATCTMVEIYCNAVFDLLQPPELKTVMKKGKTVERLVKPSVKIRCDVAEESRSGANTDDGSGNKMSDSLSAAEYEEKMKELIRDSMRLKRNKPAEKSNVFKTKAFDVRLEGAAMRSVESYADIEAILNEGNANRTTKATKMNDTSSRSHCVFSIVIRQENADTKEVLLSKVNLVDLAGSERQNKSKPSDVKESVAINLSLEALNRCIDALSDSEARHVPYRNSTLTWLLQDCLGGTAKVIALNTLYSVRLYFVSLPFGHWYLVRLR